MTKQEIITKAIDLLVKTKGVDWTIVELYPWQDGVAVSIKWPIETKEGKTVYDIQELGFVGAWFDIDDNPLDLNTACEMEKAKTLDDKLILRFAYYLYMVCYKDRRKEKLY